MTLILTLLLSLFFGDKGVKASVNPETDSNFCVSESPSKDSTADHSLNRDLCITAAQGYTFAGNNTTNSVSVRTSQTGRRTSPQTKSGFRIVKDGKVIDNNHAHPFLAQSFQLRSGIHLSERYLFAICRLRL